MEPIRAFVPFIHVRQHGDPVLRPRLTRFSTGSRAEARDDTVPEAAGRTSPVWAYLQSGRAHVTAKHAELTASGIPPSEITYPFYAASGEFRVTDPDCYALLFTHV
jgi:hypothetical protein